MTDNEAKSVLFNMLGKGIYVKDTKENQAILVALRALEREPCEECLSVIFPECRYCTHHTLRCMPDDHACEKCVRYDPIALPSGYQQKEDK